MVVKLSFKSPKPDIEATPFSSASQSALLQVRGYIERGDLENLCRAIDENPMLLVTASDTPTLLQIRFRYNALHVAAAAGGVRTLELILSYLNSLDFWRRIYPGTDDVTARERQWHVIDLYLNSPELGNLETPLHFASKFGHLPCVRLLASHPLTQMTALNRSSQTPADLAACRLVDRTNSKSLATGEVPDTPLRFAVLSSSIRRALDENFVILADVVHPRYAGERKPSILPPISHHQLQAVLARTLERFPSGLDVLFPFLFVEMCRAAVDLEDVVRGVSQTDLKDYGVREPVLSVRAFAGPLSKSEANSLRSEWLRTNSSLFSKEFASIRLSDPEKGYERQGRYFARLFGTRWFEYWDFLDGFFDLASDQGLSVLEECLKRGKLKIHVPHDRPKPSNPAKTTDASDAGIEDGAHSLDGHSYPFHLEGNNGPSTPIMRLRAPGLKSSSSDCTTTILKWQTYRAGSGVTNILNDSLEDSDQSVSQLSMEEEFLEEQPHPGSTECSSPLSPLLGLLQKLTFTSPLRWLLLDGPAVREPLFDPQRSLPPHKQSVVLLQTPRNPQQSPGKRRLSAMQKGSPPANPAGEPVMKKPSPRGPTQIRASIPVVPPLLRHICRALPAGDPELETAVAALICSREKLKATCSQKPDAPSACCLRPVSLSKFRTVSLWKKNVETAIHFSQTHNNV
ncbi:ankyrin repeat and LEM domain-containing protein 2 [Paragonimus westermani]|uniref:Ankyrin repeat and LEM domain-containing protein 2 n=1 Tax=Paragonimus westermani TaxID=34504 RepID=A0A5J4NBK8_9TREM|nr:ankyrin repeat and LEM domain-containing protein 2 [Paragonimus westermani]